MAKNVMGAFIHVERAKEMDGIRIVEAPKRAEPQPMAGMESFWLP